MMYAVAVLALIGCGFAYPPGEHLPVTEIIEASGSIPIAIEASGSTPMEATADIEKIEIIESTRRRRDSEALPVPEEPEVLIPESSTDLNIAENKTETSTKTVDAPTAIEAARRRRDLQGTVKIAEPEVVLPESSTGLTADKKTEAKDEIVNVPAIEVTAEPIVAQPESTTAAAVEMTKTEGIKIVDTPLAVDAARRRRDAEDETDAATESTEPSAESTTEASSESTTLSTIAVNQTEGSGAEVCSSLADCQADSDCGSGKCVGAFLGTCNCNACLSFIACSSDEQCGGFKSACQNGICDCFAAYARNGFKDSFDGMTNLCNVKSCGKDGSASECFGLPCNTGRCFC